MRICFTILIAVFILPVFTVCVRAQAPILEWQHIFGGTKQEAARCIRPLPNGGYLVVGSSTSSNIDLRENKGGYDYWVVQMTSGATLDWQRNYGGSGNDFARSVTILPDSGFIVAGESSSTDGDVTNPKGKKDYWLLRCNNVGHVLWQKSLGGSGDDVATCVQATPDGGCIVSGYSNSVNGDVSGNRGNDDYWIAKLSATGTLQWQKTYGGSNADQANDIHLTTDGGYIVAGASRSTDGQVVGNKGGYDYWIIKLDSKGDVLWQKCFGGSGDDLAQSIRQTTDGGYIVAGHSESTNGDVTANRGAFDYWIVKLNATGNLEWQKSLGGTANELAYTVTQTPDGHFIAGGYTLSNDGDVTGNHGAEDVWLTALSANGALLWQKTIGGSTADIGYDLQHNADSTILIAGVTASNDGDATYNFGMEDFWLIKLAPCIPRISIGATAFYTCAGQGMVFKAGIAQGGHASSFQWMQNGKAVGINSPEYKPVSIKAGDSIYCILTSTAACAAAQDRVVASNVVVIQAADLNRSPFNIVDNGGVACEGTTLRFKTSIYNGATHTKYQWAVNGTTIIGADASSFSSDALQHLDTVVASATLMIDTCTLMAADTIIVKLQPLVTPAVSITGTTLVCENDTAVFTATVTNGGNQPNYQWLVNGDRANAAGSIFETSALKHGDTVRCRVSYDSGCFLPALSNGLVMQVEQAPVITGIKDVSVNSGSSIVLPVQVTGNGLSYSWSPATGLSNTSIANPIAAPEQTTTYTLGVVSANGCSTFVRLTVNVIQTISVPSAFSPNGDGINDTWMIRGINAYPQCRVKLFDRYGKLVFNSVGYNVPWNGTAKGKPLPSGAYYYVIETEVGKSTLTGAVMLIR